MFPYWLLFMTLAFSALIYNPRGQFVAVGSGATPVLRRMDPIFWFLMFMIVMMIGLRFRVGGDWKSYLATFQYIAALPISQALKRLSDEAGYTVLNWLVIQVGGGMWLVNSICAIPLVAGLIAISRREANPYLPLAVAAPLIIIVVGMGFTRQSVALGFLLLGLAELLKGKSFWYFLGWTLVGSLFHLTVLVFIPLVALFSVKGKASSIFLLMLAAALGYFVLLPSALDRYSAGYIRSVYEAQGAVFRLALNGLAAVILLLLPRRFLQSSIEAQIWRGWALLAIASLGALYFVRSTVIVDRLAVYILPLQMFVFGRLPVAFGGPQSSKPWTVVVIVGSAAVLLTWLTLANHARFWVPYQMYPLSYY